MTTKEARSKINLFRRRRGHLKAALMKHAKTFDMALWFQGDYLVTTTLERALFNSQPFVPVRCEIATAVKDFEQCGTACCIAGFDFLRSGRTMSEIVRFYGFLPSTQYHDNQETDLFIAVRWPVYLSNKYFKASNTGDKVGMVEAAQKAIDYFGNEGDKKLLESATD